jgi:hypothetical protein
MLRLKEDINTEGEHLQQLYYFIVLNYTQYVFQYNFVHNRLLKMSSNAAPIVHHIHTILKMAIFYLKIHCLHHGSSNL